MLVNDLRPGGSCTIAEIPVGSVFYYNLGYYMKLYGYARHLNRLENANYEYVVALANGVIDVLFINTIVEKVEGKFHRTA